MKLNLLSTSILGALSALLPLTVHANFEQASQHLDLDGSLVGYINFEGDGQEIGTALNRIYQEIITSTPEIPPIPFDFTQLFTNLGFGSVRSIAFSSKEIEPNLHKNLSIALLNGELTGLFNMYGNESHTFSSAETAPADATGALTATIDLTVLRDTITILLQQVMGPIGEGIAEQQLAQFIPATDITINEAIEALSGKWDSFWLQSYKDNFEPEFKFWVSIENAGSLLTRIQPLGETLPIIFSEDAASLKADLSALLGSESPISLFVEAPKDSSQLILYSDPDWSATSEGPRLTENPEFAALAKRLPTEGLAFTYSAGADLTPMLAMLESQPKIAKYAGVLRSAIDLLIGDYLKPNIMVSTIKDDAFISEQYASYSTKQTVMVIPTTVGIGLGAAIAIPAFQEMRITSQKEAVANNLNQIAAAASQYFFENNATEVSIDQLVGPGLYIPSIETIAGESYEGMIITTEMEEISVTLGDGSVISIDF